MVNQKNSGTSTGGGTLPPVVVCCAALNDEGDASGVAQRALDLGIDRDSKRRQAKNGRTDSRQA